MNKGIVVYERLTRTRVASEHTLPFTLVSCVDQHLLVLQCARVTRHVASPNNHTSLKGTVTTI